MLYSNINEAFESKYGLGSNELDENISTDTTEFDNIDDDFLDEGIWDRIQNRKIDKEIDKDNKEQIKTQKERDRFSDREAYNKEYARIMAKPGMDQATAKKIMRLWKANHLVAAQTLEDKVEQRYQYLKKKGMINGTEEAEAAKAKAQGTKTAEPTKVSAEPEEQQYNNKGLDGKPASTTTGLGDYNTDFPQSHKSNATKSKTSAPKELDQEDIMNAVNAALMKNDDIAGKLTFNDRQAIEDSVRQNLNAVMNANIKSVK